MTLDELKTAVRADLQKWAIYADGDAFAPWIVEALQAMAAEVDERINRAAGNRP
jgi:hypothetical protein